MNTPKLDALLSLCADITNPTVSESAAAELAALKARCDELARAVEKRDAVLSRIDYLLDDRPNDRDVSYYDLHDDPETVQKRFEADLAGLKSELIAWRMFAEHQIHCDTCANDGVGACVNGSSLWVAADPTMKNI